MQRSPVFPRIPLGDEFKISSLNQETEKIGLFTVWNVFLLYCCVFGWQGRRHSTSFLRVFDVILVKLNEWIPVLFSEMPLKICFVLT